MATKKFNLAALSLAFLFIACGDDSSKPSSEQDVVSITDKTISGVSQKGPFVNGSSVTVQELDGESLAQTGSSYEGKIKNDKGEFSVKVAKLASQFVLLKANGFYRNEVSGDKSKSQITLYALTDVSDRDEVNVNLLTHLEHERSLYLVSENSMTIKDAKKQAEGEILASFGIEGEFANTEDLNIFGTDDGAAALLAVSVLLQGDLSEADFSERLAYYASDIESDGKWDDLETATAIADWASSKSLKGELANIRNNIAEWKLSDDVPAFEKYVDNFWWKKYGLGICDETREGEVLATTNKHSANYGSQVRYICKSNSWREFTIWDASKEAYLNPDIEYDSITDIRDNQSYKIVKIGSQVWMAENLNYADSNKTPILKENSRCYGNEMKNCEVAGRYYDKKTIAEICPQGWHIPSQAEWEVLIETVGGSNIVKYSSWWEYNPVNFVGMNDYGFSIIPAGNVFGAFYGDCEESRCAAFFTSTECVDGVKELELDFVNERAYFTCDPVGFAYNVRCIKDEE